MKVIYKLFSNQQIEFVVSLFQGADIRSIVKASQTEIALSQLL